MKTGFNPCEIRAQGGNDEEKISVTKCRKILVRPACKSAKLFIRLESFNRKGETL